jgi:hypothetical protein
MIKALKIFHIVTAAVVLGADVALLTLGIAGLQPTVLPELYIAAHLIVRWLLGPVAIAALGSGLLLAWQMHYSLTGTKWIAAKLAITTFLTTLIYVALEPGLATAASHVAANAGKSLSAAARWRVAIAPAAASALLIVNVTLAVLNARSAGRQLRQGGVP